MKKLFAILLASLLLTACQDGASQLNPKVLPSGLKDCQFFEVFHDMERIVVVRCPLSTATAQVVVQDSEHHPRTKEVLLVEGK